MSFFKLTLQSKFTVKQSGSLVLLCILSLGSLPALMAVTPADAQRLAASTDATAVERSANIEFLGITEFDGDATDGSGLVSELEDQSPADRLGGFSAIEYTGKADRFILLADRGAGDGAVSFPCRMHEIDLRLAKESRTIEAEFASTILLKAPDASPLNGSETTSLIDRSQPAGQTWHAMDPEGIRRWGDGFLISDEYGPHLGTFNRFGQMTGEWKLPASRCYGTAKVTSSTSEKAFGCFDNKGLEGLAVTPSRKIVWASYQSSLLQDGEMDGLKCRGDMVRWVAFNPKGQRVREVAYPLEYRKSGISEVLAVDEDRLLVLERDSGAGSEAKIKQIFLADVRDASDVSSIDSLPTDKESLLGRSDSMRLVKKQLLINLMDWHADLGDAATAEKPEGLAWGQPLEDGRRTLWICWDNDFETQRKSYVACFAVDLD